MARRAPALLKTTAHPRAVTSALGSFAEPRLALEPNGAALTKRQVERPTRRPPAPTASNVETPRPRLDEIDLRVAAQLRQHRLASGLSAPALAARLGVRHALLRSAETGQFRVSAGYLHRFASALGVSVDALFEPVEEGGVSAKRLIVLMRAFHAIADPDLRTAVIVMSAALAAASARQRVARVAGEGTAAIRAVPRRGRGAS